MKKIKKAVASIIAFFIALPMKVWGYSLVDGLQPMYGVDSPVEKAEPTIIELYWKVARVLIIPLVLIIGLSLYVKRKPESKLNKYLTVRNLIIFLIISFAIIFFTGCDKKEKYNNDVMNSTEDTTQNTVQQNNIKNNTAMNKTTEIDITMEDEIDLTLQEQALIQKGFELFGETYCKEGKCTCEKNTSIMASPTIESYNKCKLCYSEWRSGISSSEDLCPECSDITKRCAHCCNLLRKCENCEKYIYWTSK